MRGGPPPSAVIVHSHADVARAARLAADLRVPVTIMTAPGAADYAGPDVLFAMVQAGLAEAPGADIVAIIDCADAAGRAQAALRAGWRHILFTGHPDAAARLADLARQSGASLLTARPR